MEIWDNKTKRNRRATTRTAVTHRGVIAGLHNRLVWVRKAHGVTQEMLAGRLGVDQATISSLETGRTLPSVPLLFQFAQLFHVFLEWLASAHGPVFVATPGRIHYLGDAEYADACRAAVALVEAEEIKRSFCRLDVYGIEAQHGWLFWSDEDQYITILPGEHKPGTMLGAFAQLILAGHSPKGSLRVSPEEVDSLLNCRLPMNQVQKWIRQGLDQSALPEVVEASGLSVQERKVIRDSIGRVMEPPRCVDKGSSLKELMTLLEDCPHLVGTVLDYARRKSG